MAASAADDIRNGDHDDEDMADNVASATDDVRDGDD